MSCDFAVWRTGEKMDDEAAARLYAALCDGDTSGVEPCSAIDAFYRELTAMHPEIDDVPEDAIDDTDLCPWSIAFDRSPGHLIMCCVWSKAEHVEGVIKGLAAKHGLAVFDPQAGAISWPGSGSRDRKPWWKIW